jgi:hypothetical protein
MEFMQTELLDFAPIEVCAVPGAVFCSLSLTIVASKNDHTSIAAQRSQAPEFEK